MGKGYEKKFKVTRVALADYLLLKGFAQAAGVSMAEALHKLIAGLKPGPKPEPEPVPVTEPIPSYVVTAKVAGGYILHPLIVTNGSKIPAFRIKQGGAKYE
ncbi:hypothetical protein ES708_23967 [subsurface metagenome]